MSADLISPIPASDGHFAVDTLADFDAGVYDDTVTIGLKEHLATCVQCGQVLVALEDVRLRLRTLPEIQMPDRIADQVFHALRMERENGTPAHPGPVRVATGPSAEPSVDSSHRVIDISLARERRAKRVRWTSWVAAGVVLLGTGISVAAVVTHHSSESPQAGQQSPPASSSPALPEYDDESIKNGLAVIALRGRITNGTSPGAEIAGRMAQADERSKCQAGLASMGITEEPIAVEAIKYEGKPSFVFLYSGGHAVVVAEQCDSTGTQVLFRQ